MEGGGGRGRGVASIDISLTYSYFKKLISKEIWRKIVIGKIKEKNLFYSAEK